MFRFFLSIFCFFLISFQLNANNDSYSQHQYIAVVDAGSTGSRLHIFTYDLDETNTPINIKEIWSKKTTPGFASLESKQNIVHTYMTNLFTGAPVTQMPVYFYATAGMRLVPQAKQKMQYQYLKTWFDQQNNWQLMDSKTITGTEEALYDWLSVNYYLGNLKPTSKESVGVLDIGGASTQIAFSLKNNQELDNKKQTTVELTLYGQPIHLFVQSFLGLGQNEMGHQLLDTNSCFPKNYPLSNGEKGEGNAVDCAHEISLLINGLHKTNDVIKPALVNNPVNTWYAIGGIANLAESTPFQFSNNQLTNEHFLEQGNQKACQQSWEQLNNNFPNNEYLDTYCILPAFYYALMVDGYGFSADQIVNYVPSNKNLDWTLGVVFHH